VPNSIICNQNIPVVSIIIPTHNRAHFIGEAITSVLEQTFTDFEIIIVDDGSTDNTEEVISHFPDKRVIYIKQENKGRSYARNVALRLSRGHYIAFLDSDDLYLPTKLRLQVDYLDTNPKIGMIYTSAYCIDDAGNLLKDKYFASVSGQIYNSIAFFRPVTITLPTVMVRREVIDSVGDFDEKMHRFEDTDMWRRISKATYIDALSEYTCKLRTHSDNSLISQNPHQIIEAIDYYANKILHEDSEKGRVRLRYGIGGIYYYYGRGFFTISAWQNDAISLLQTSYNYCRIYHFIYIFHKTFQQYMKYYRMIMFSKYNLPYRIYNKLKARKST